MISLEKNLELKRNKTLEQELKEMYEEGKQLFEEYVPAKLTPLTEKQIYDLITTVCD
ncbi:MAG: hypothetical protein V1888_02765 [archaeon]